MTKVCLVLSKLIVQTYKRLVLKRLESYLEITNTICAVKLLSLRQRGKEENRPRGVSETQLAALYGYWKTEDRKYYYLS